MASLFGGRREVATARPAPDNVETLIGPSSHINGEIKSDGNLHIEGLVEGSIECAGSVMVGPNGRVLATISARHVLIAGSVKGNIQAEQGLKIAATGKLWGDIVVGSLLIEEGGLFRGQCTMRDDTPPELPAGKPLNTARQAG